MKVLFVTANRLGDAVLSTGLLRWLEEHHPGARVTLACGPAAAALFRAVPQVERIITLQKRRWSLHWVTLWLAAAGTMWDLVVDLRASAIAYLLATRRRSVLRKVDRPEHRLRLLARAMRLPDVAAPKLWLTADHRAAARDLLPAGVPLLALGPTANWGGKQWPVENFAELARRLIAPGSPLAGGRVAVFGAPGERESIAALFAALPAAQVIDLVGRIDLLVVAAAIERCRLFIGNDSGLMHLAAATGTPTLGLFGPSRETHYAPWGEYCAAVRTPESYEAIFHAPGYDYRSQRSLMTSLTVPTVENAARELLARVDAAVRS
ncbi:MAG: glycosyltransferase family 9 protein [Alphaproteobacteria bacterium]|nr:glycosyltransferase family 9 protein [Alphaproteobacteria bacterium]